MTDIIEVTHLTHSFGSHPALQDVNYRISAGEIVGLLGPNGAGKTTTIRLLNGLYHPTAGQIRVLGKDPVEEGAQVRAHTGVLTESPALYERLNALQNLEFFGSMNGLGKPELTERIQTLLEFFDLQARAKNRVDSFSKGMKQRLAIARAILHQPDLVFLDEPTSGLDPEAAQQVHAMIQAIHGKEGKTVLLCTHQLIEAERLCSKLIIMNHGRILAQGSLQELRRQYDPGQEVHLELMQPASEGLCAGLGQLKGISKVVVENPTMLKLKVTDESNLREIALYLMDQRIPYYALTSLQVSLEEIYFFLQNQEKEGAL